MHGPLADEDIGDSVEQGVQDRLPLEFVQHDHARSQVVVQQQRSQQDRQIGHPAMAAEDQDRAGTRLRCGLDGDREVEGSVGRRPQTPQPPGHQAVVSILDPRGIHPRARAGDHPQTEKTSKATAS